MGSVTIKAYKLGGLESWKVSENIFDIQQGRKAQENIIQVFETSNLSLKHVKSLYFLQMKFQTQVEWVKNDIYCRILKHQWTKFSRKLLKSIENLTQDTLLTEAASGEIRKFFISDWAQNKSGALGV